MERTIRLNNPADVSRLVLITSRAAEPVQVKSGRYIVDGKSILGLLSLDIHKPLTIEYDESDAEAMTGIELFEPGCADTTFIPGGCARCR